MMGVTTFDTLKFVRRLEEVGVPSEQAEVQAEVLTEAFNVNLEELVTKDYLTAEFAKQNARIETKISERFAEQQIYIDKRFADGFAEQQIYIDKRFADGFAEQKVYMNKRFSDGFAEQKVYMNKRFSDGFAEIKAELADNSAKQDLRFEQIETRFTQLDGKFNQLYWMLGALILGVAVPVLERIAILL